MGWIDRSLPYTGLIYGTVRCEKSVLSVCLLQRDGELGRSCVKGNYIKAYISDMKELFVLE